MADENPGGSGAGSQPKLLSGGNPQIPKADGDAPVQAYIAAMPGWKRAAGAELRLRDQLINEGRFHLSTTLFAGQRWLRIVVMSPQTDEKTIDQLLERLRQEAP